MLLHIFVLYQYEDELKYIYIYNEIFIKIFS